jgi:UDP-N-acetylglucosamine--N-acetylmuramyl-(pentapeptide) pyrophosphoryl-undecaprenol N-acetylglucosamine transferase
MALAILVAGGTGGHINAALAVGEKLQEEGHEVIYFTGKRQLDYKLFQNVHVKHLDSRPLRTHNPITLVKNIILNIVSFISIFIFLLRKRPRFLLGAGGYVCGPTLLAGFIQFIPVYIIEQNAVMGLTNKILGWISSRIFVHFSKTKGLSAVLQKKVLVVGNPTRKSIYPVPTKKLDETLKVLVFGGSLGAKQINDVIFDLLKIQFDFKLEIHHQVGIDQSISNVDSKISYHPMSYIENIQKEYEWCDVIISRAGASTISELALIRKPVLIFPYPKATDNHQLFNAKIFQEEADFSVEVLDPQVSHLEALNRVKEFLVKASKEELNYTQKKLTGNTTCEQILREIKLHARMA